MKYQIVHDMPGRLRVRCGARKFDLEQGVQLTEQLLSWECVEKVAVSHVNGSILIYYVANCRKQVLQSLQQLKLSQLPALADQSLLKARQLDLNFQNGLMKKVACHWACKLLPAPLRMLRVLWKSAGYIKDGLHSLLRLRLDVAVLDGTAIGLSLWRGSYQTAGSIMFLLSISELLEEYTYQKSREALASSLALHIDKVWIRRGEMEVEVPLNSVQVDDVVIVRMGSMIPIDGEIVQGRAMINEAALTGESMAVEKAEGASVFAGTVVEDGWIAIRVNAVDSETRIQKILQLIDQSEDLKAGIQSKAESLADGIVPYSFLLAMAVGVFTRNLTKAISVLLVDYSCAIKLATPIVVISAMNEAATHEIMVKGGKYLEAMAVADCLVFDKTGTLTVAMPKVEQVIAFGEYSRDSVLRTAACLEEHFPHSVARAIVRQAEEESLHHQEDHAEVEYIVAHGIVSQLDGKRVVIGSKHFVMEDEDIHISHQQQMMIAQQAKESSVIYLGVDGQLVGVICITDPIRQEAEDMIVQLRQLGIQRVVMLTGDDEKVAAKVARELGIDEYQGQMLPEEKAAFIKQMKEDGHCVVMVGDGINDSPALAAADLSVAMKDASDIAREVADVTMLSGTLNELVTLRKLSQQMVKRIHRNYGWIVAINSLLLFGGLFNVITPATSALLHNSTTLGLSVLSTQPCLKEGESHQRT